MAKTKIKNKVVEAISKLKPKKETPAAFVPGGVVKGNLYKDAINNSNPSLKDLMVSNDCQIVDVKEENVDSLDLTTVLDGFLHSQNHGHLKFLLPVSQENHRTMLCFCSMLNISDVNKEHEFNTEDHYALNHYYESMGGSLEFILERNKSKLSLTVSKI